MSAARYLPHGPFHAALETRVAAYFQQTGKSPTDVPGMRLKTAIICTWLAGSWAFGVFFATTWWQVALAAISIGLAMAGVGFSIQHDGSHKAYSAKGSRNGLAAAGLDLIGANSYIWAWKHNILHHSNPNCVGLDADIDIQPFCRLAPAQKYHPWQRAQHFYIWFLYSLLAFKWLFDDFRDVLNGAVGGQKFLRPRGWKLAQFLAGKVFFVSWSMIIPALLHPVANVAAAWVLGSVTISLMLALIFQLAHVVEGAQFHVRDAGAPMTWAESQVISTADFGQHDALLTWYVGGLNFQVEHHLFPKICHLHYPALAPIVKATCEEFSVPYFAYPSALSALASHVRWLKTMGQGESLAPANVADGQQYRPAAS